MTGPRTAGGGAVPGAVAPEEAEVVVLGMLPPPTTGAAKNTLILAEDLIGRGVRTAALSTATGGSGSALRRSLGYHWARVRHFLRTARALRRRNARTGERTLYMVPDGGAGIVYSAAYAKLAKAHYARVVLHHRAFQYIDRPNRWMRSICRALDGKLTHVFLSEGMRDRFQAAYGVQPSLVVGNARYVRPLASEKARDELVLGHLSNLAALKGFHECAATFIALHGEGLPVRLVLAGPVHDETIRAALDRLLAEYPGSVEYLGPLQGEAKDAFYRRIHLFLFPTKWPQEAQPNVIYEAFAGAAAVVAYGRGAIPEMVPPGLGLVIPPEDDFARHAVPYIRAFRENRAQAPSAAQFHAEIGRQAEISRAQHEQLVELLVAHGG